MIEVTLSRHAESSRTKFGMVLAEGVSSPRGHAGGVRANRVVVRSSLVRKGCDGSYDFGLGASVEVLDIAASAALAPGTIVEISGERACFDVDIAKVFGVPKVRVTQDAPIELAGICAPTLSGLRAEWEPKRSLSGGVVIEDRSACLKALHWLAPRYPDELIPTRARLEFGTRQVDLVPRPVADQSGVGALAEISTRLEGADARVSLAFDTVGQAPLQLCLSKNRERLHSRFEMELGVDEAALETLSAPFISPDNRDLVRDLRTDVARCDGSGGGLAFRSDLKEVKLQGRVLSSRTQVGTERVGLQPLKCGDGGNSSCGAELGVIQFTEEGELSEPAQLESIANALAKSARPPLVVVFLHGWRHSAHPSDGDLFDFRQVVRRIGESQSRVAEENRRRVVGVFLGWPGRLYDSVSANKLATFWNRLEVARSLGQPSSDLERAFLTLYAATHTHQDSDWARLVALGHSMGAASLFEVLGTGDAASVADLSVLINPAISVGRVKRARQNYRGNKPILIYGSVSDQVTQQFYPLGEALTAKSTERAELFHHTTTITNDASQITHRLRMGEPGSIDALVGADALSSEAVQGETPEPSLCRHSPGQSLEADCLPGEFQWSQMGNAVVAVGEDIIPSHAKFFTEPFVAHLLHLIEFNTSGSAKRVATEPSGSTEPHL